MADVNFENEELKPEHNETDENFVTLYEDAEESKDISKDFMGSIGSWINDLFNVTVPAKRSSTAPEGVKASRKPDMEKLDSEYLKSLNIFKEEMKKKLKNKTTVHLSTKDKFLEFDFDKRSDKVKKKSNWMGSDSDAAEKQVSAMIPQESNEPFHKLAIKINEKENIHVTLRPDNGAKTDKSILVKEKLLKKERSKNSELEEYCFATPPELSRSLLLNISDQEKFSQLYKNGHLGIQEPQAYKQRLSGQHNARCYTTNANLVETLKGNSLITVNKKNKRPGFTAAESSVACSTDECLVPKKGLVKLKRKPFSELIGDGLDKAKSAKRYQNSFADSSKNESKSSSEELVKHLIKKTKATSHSQSLKRKSSNLPAETNPRARFLQSATSSLYVNVLAKKESNVLLPLKASFKSTPDNKILKLDRGVKDWSHKHRDIRFEIKKVPPPRFNKSSYLNDVNDRLDCQVINSAYRPFKRSNEDLSSSSSLFQNMKEQIAKNKKAEDIRQILSKIDQRYDTMKANEKLRKTEQENEQSDARDAQNARFQKQHERFKSNFIAALQTEIPEPQEGQETPIDDKSVSCSASADSSEVIILNAEVQPITPKSEETENCEVALLEYVESSPLVCEKVETIIKEDVDKGGSGENNHSPKSEKAKVSQHKNKLVKTKSSQYLKEEDMKQMLEPLTNAQKDSQSQKQISKPYERQLSPTEIRPQTSLEPVLINRTYSTNVTGSNQKSLKLLPFGQPKGVLMLSDDKGSGEKKESKDKKKEKIEKNVTIKEMKENCGFESSKKPGPNCEK